MLLQVHRHLCIVPHQEFSTSIIQVALHVNKKQATYQANLDFRKVRNYNGGNLFLEINIPDVAIMKWPEL